MSGSDVPGKSGFIDGPPSQLSVPQASQLQFIQVSRIQWTYIRDAASRQMNYPFLWFNNAGVFLLGFVPAAVLFLIGWGPIYDGLSPDLQNRYGLVPGFVIIGTIAIAVLGLFFLFLDHKQHEQHAEGAGSIVEMMDRAHAPEVSPPDPPQ